MQSFIGLALMVPEIIRGVLSSPHMLWSSHSCLMLAGIHISQDIFAIDMLTALKPSLEHYRKHVVQLL